VTDVIETAPTSTVSRGTTDSDDGRRSALIDAIPQTDESTPLAAQLAQDTRRRITLRGRRFPAPPQTRVLTVANQKGGVGKTTTAVNLAASLAQAGLRVLVIDNDPQGNASTALGIDHHAGTPSVYDVLVNDLPLAGVVRPCPNVTGLFGAPATIDLSGAEIELVDLAERERRLRGAVDAYLATADERGERRPDYIFVDCPPSLGLLTVNAFVCAREVLIPIQCEYYALEGLSQLLRNIDLIRRHLNPDLRVSTILLTMFDGRTNLAHQVAEEVRGHFPDATLGTHIPRSVRVSEAPSYSQTVLTYDPGSSGALAYLAAAREIAYRGAGLPVPDDGAAPPSRREPDGANAGDGFPEPVGSHA
jgi:chromosome partitioning protein